MRVPTRLLKKAKDELGLQTHFMDLTTRAKRRMLGIQHAKNHKVRVKRYKDLLKVTERTIGYSTRALKAPGSQPLIDPMKAALSMSITEDLERFMALAQQVVEQTVHRVINDEKVPSAQKIVSLFEPQTDIIKKDRRDTYMATRCA